MRWLLTIWMVYMFALTAMPCSDAGNNCNAYDPKTTTSYSHDHHQDSNDNCSPFCHCSCCSICIVSHDIKPFEIRQPKMFFATHEISLPGDTPISGYDGKIWNPPKFTI